MAPTITGRCLASAMLGALVVNAVQDGTFPSEGLTSSVDIRNLDSFMLSKPTHYDFENVMFYDGDMCVASLGGHPCSSARSPPLTPTPSRLPRYLYAGSEERKTELEAQLKDWKDAVYKQATSPLPLPAVRDSQHDDAPRPSRTLTAPQPPGPRLRDQLPGRGRV